MCCLDPKLLWLVIETWWLYKVTVNCTIPGREDRELRTVYILSIYLLMFKLYSQSVLNQKSEKVMQTYPLWLQGSKWTEMPIPVTSCGYRYATQGDALKISVTGQDTGQGWSEFELKKISYCSPAFLKVFHQSRGWWTN